MKRILKICLVMSFKNNFGMICSFYFIFFSWIDGYERKFDWLMCRMWEKEGREKKLIDWFINIKKKEEREKKTILKRVLKIGKSNMFFVFFYPNVNLKTKPNGTFLLTNMSFVCLVFISIKLWHGCIIFLCTVWLTCALAVLCWYCLLIWPKNVER